MRFLLSLLSLDGSRDEWERVTLWLAAGLDEGWHGFRESPSYRAWSPQGKLSPNHGMTQRAWAGIVGRCDTFHTKGRP